MIPAEDIKVSIWPPEPKSGMTTGRIPHGVLVHHVPTGIIVTCDSERTQHANRVNAVAEVERLVALVRAPIGDDGPDDGGDQ